MAPRFWWSLTASLALSGLFGEAASGTIRPNRNSPHPPPAAGGPSPDIPRCCGTGPAPAVAVRRGTTAAGWLAERDSRATPPAKTTGRVYRLASDFGADPSGHTDAADAFDAAFAELWAHPSEATNDWMMPDGAIMCTVLQ